MAVSREANPRLFVVGQIHGRPESPQPSGRVVAFPAPAAGAGRPDPAGLGTVPGADRLRCPLIARQPHRWAAQGETTGTARLSPWSVAPVTWTASSNWPPISAALWAALAEDLLRSV